MWEAVLVDAPYVHIKSIEIIGDNDNLNLSDAEKAYEDYMTGDEDWEKLAICNMAGIGIGGSDGRT